MIIAIMTIVQIIMSKRVKFNHNVFMHVCTITQCPPECIIALTPCLFL